VSKVIVAGNCDISVAGLMLSGDFIAVDLSSVCSEVGLQLE